MTKRFRLKLVTKHGERQVTFDAKELVLAGFTGRSREQVLRHIEEMRRHGIQPPASIPVSYRVPADLLTTGSRITVRSEHTSGEVEYVALFGEGGIWMGVGSDHTDREIEKRSIIDSKLACPKVLAPDVWDFDEVKDHWDRLIIRSKVDEGSIYQESELGSILELQELAKLLPKSREGIVLFSGTVPLTRQLSYSPSFSVEIDDTILRRKITHTYGVNVSGSGVR